MVIEFEHKPLLLEALEELMYKLSLQLEEQKGQPMSEHRRILTDKQKSIEQLQHQISILEE